MTKKYPTKQYLSEVISNREFSESVPPEIVIVMARQLLAGMEQEPVADVVAWHHPTEERTCDIRLRRHDLAPGPLYAAPQLPQPAVPECYQRLLHHAYGMTMGHDWNKGTMAGHHREKLCKAVEDCRAAMLQGGK